jgi:uncharacterized repeat protein (TIGR03833 family)
VYLVKYVKTFSKISEDLHKDVLTKSSYHPHGIKVRLETGEVGRVKEVINERIG